MSDSQKTRLSEDAWRERVEALTALARACGLCPRNCGVDRLADERGDCGGGARASLVAYHPHHGEEACLSGSRGSGTLFFGHCNLHCVFCQNADISQHHGFARAYEVSDREVARAMMRLQQLGCHNLNLVSPTHCIYAIVRALYLASRRGFSLPIVYNTHSYDSVWVLRHLEGVVDVYLADLKYADDEVARRLGAPGDYVERAREAIREMYRQVGGLKTNAAGLAYRGLLVRLLVLPNNLGGCDRSLLWLRGELGADVGVNIMGQYRPCHLAPSFPELRRRIKIREYWPLVELARELGFRHIDFDRSFLLFENA